MTSIWLRPEGRQEQMLQRLIGRQAEKHGTVPFAPHLTVCGVPGDLGVLDAAAAYVRQCRLLPIRAAKTAVTGAVITPFRAVFIEVENSPELREFRERLREIVSAPELIPPHISLLYTLDRDTQTPRPDFDAERLQEIAARCAGEIDDTHFTLGRPVVNNAGGGESNVRGWRAIREL
jgi:2'-5' RNA ligase